MFYNFTKFILKILIPIFNIKVIGDVKILERYENAIVCANHSSNWDPFFISIILPRKISWLAKIELFRNPLFNFLLSKLGMIPIDRKKADLKAIKSAMRVLKDGETLGIFIEGTRVDYESEDNAKSGAIMIADKTSSPILPIKISSEYKLFKKTEIIIGEPFLAVSDKNEYDKDAKKLLKTIYELDVKK